MRNPIAFVALASLCVLRWSAPALAQVQPKEAEPAVKRANAAVLGQLPFDNRQDFEDARRGFLGTVPDLVVRGAGDREVWNLRDYAFLQQDTTPATVNPSLWRQAQLNYVNGLFKVTDGLYQIRGFDLANMTIVEGRRGLIVIDPLTTVEVAQAALSLYFQHRPQRAVVAVVYTHSHADHFGGVKGVISDQDVVSGKTEVIAPAGFLESAESEYILAGTAMSRRAQYQFGPLLPKGERSQVDAGLGKVTARGTRSLIAPTVLIQKPLEKRTIDGVEIVFQLAPGSEAPAEMHLYFPKLKTLDIAENATHTLHNLLPFRGTVVRDANAWSGYLNQALDQFGRDAQILIAQHHWPTWGNERVTDLLRKQRDLYKYLHDQTLRLINQGLTPTEIAETLRLPPSLSNEWYARDYYGTVSHNARAIYQKYLGWYDANPANLNPLPPAASGKKFVEYMGGATAVMQRAREDFNQGQYRWVAQVMSHVVFAEPGNREARELAADAYEQLGYLAESATWRNAYLFGAWELRNGVPTVPPAPFVAPDVLKALPVEALFDYMGVRINGTRAQGRRMVSNWIFTDSRQRFVLNLENGALTYAANTQSRQASVTLTLARETLAAVLLGEKTFGQAAQAGAIAVGGDADGLKELADLMDDFQAMFEIVEPKRKAR